jgi:hypothetical protein
MVDKIRISGAAFYGDRTPRITVIGAWKTQSNQSLKAIFIQVRLE